MGLRRGTDGDRVRRLPCRDPTQITVLVTTDIVNCENLPGTTIAVGAPDSLATALPSSVSGPCQDGTIGSLVIVLQHLGRARYRDPRRHGREREPGRLRRRMATRAAASSRGARFHFIAHTPLTVPVDMRSDCENVVQYSSPGALRDLCAEQVFACDGAGPRPRARGRDAARRLSRTPAAPPPMPACRRWTRAGPNRVHGGRRWHGRRGGRRGHDGRPHDDGKCRRERSGRRRVHRRGPRRKRELCRERSFSHEPRAKMLLAKRVLPEVLRGGDGSLQDGHGLLLLDGMPGRHVRLRGRRGSVQFGAGLLPPLNMPGKLLRISGFAHRR